MLILNIFNQFSGLEAKLTHRDPVGWASPVQLVNNLILSDIISILIIIGIILTFLPQQIRIVNNRSSNGLSPYFMLLSITSVLAQLANVLMLQIPLLQNATKEELLSSILGILQVVILSICITINFILFIIYQTPFQNKRIFILCIKLFLLFLFLSTFIIILALLTDKLQFVGKCFGILSIILSCIQYIPQLIHTWITKYIGALSLITLTIQAPGSFFFAYTLACIPNSHITTWFPFFLSGIFQFILIIICFIIKIYYNVNDNSETESLLG